MVQQDGNHPLLLSLLEESQKLFGFKILSWEEISLGWLNLKWKLETDQGDFFLKLYHAKRYSNIDVLHRALHQQQKLFRAGLPCPELIAHNDNLLHSFSDNKYVIMRFCSGRIVKSKDINTHQMYELGNVTGRMHQIMNDGSYNNERNVQFIPQNREDRISHWKSIIEEVKNDDKPFLISKIELHMNLTATIDIDCFEAARPGWAHRDLWRDNLLFDKDKVSAILDFDRFNYDYPELDIARAIMSWAYDNGNFYPELASAFLQGYRSFHEYSSGNLVNSLRMLWYLESVWWINAKMEQHSSIQARFAEEMTWLAENNEKLPLILCEL